MKKTSLVVLATAALMIFVSCGSKPEPEPEVKPSAPETVVEEPVVNEEENSAEDAALAAEEADKAAREAALKAYEKALASKLEIEESELIEYDQKNYDEGNKLLLELEAMLKDDSVTGAQLEEKAKEVNARYNSVLYIGYKQLAKYWRDEAYESKRKADSVKAGVAEKDRYKNAVKEFKEGDTLYAMQAAEKAINHYIDADDEFSALYEEISVKRAAAQAAIEAAKKAVAEAEKLAAAADITDPVDENTEGIEAEDAVLLEETEYANPDDAIEEVPETMAETEGDE
ncbi:MAG: hypothetical protein MJ185_00540 [Treponema sp.]|nr:hypothetical protein [Treponema sp.]